MMNNSKLYIPGRNAEYGQCSAVTDGGDDDDSWVQLQECRMGQKVSQSVVTRDGVADRASCQYEGGIEEDRAEDHGSPVQPSLFPVRFRPRSLAGSSANPIAAPLIHPRIQSPIHPSLRDCNIHSRDRPSFTASPLRYTFFLRPRTSHTDYTRTD
ncbi:uncharacterized protein BO88DRAFT_183465 [Aspergillus vadensis CBS 113365]|uniref:Uncharacterized protein n=1 Tax=Aspergillus vadensis (strain CBS 113365 / IMI 142717 / IBT 24658) TaxID=1448311 RepID=A0A319AX13_ASPVC|nr:hypothetical protein BO88DRAFT_183465 [Aspergillus vadensis CBS 113365]PYH64164.1 hypothetical protein BO88DRAFT_183465 [Aspergillus vadensis CBS 113365]